MKPTLVVLAAGMGSRYGGLKQVDGLGPNGETIIDYSVYDAMRAGFGKVVFIIRKSIEADFMAAFGNRFSDKIEVKLVFQELDLLPKGFMCPADRVKPWGTGHAVWAAKDVVSEPFAVINADDFYGRQSFAQLADALTHGKAEGQAYMVGYKLRKTLSEEGTVSRGVCKVDANSLLVDVVEHTKIGSDGNSIFNTEDDGSKKILSGDASVSMNCWGFTPDFFDHAERMLKEFLTDNIASPKAEFYIPLVVNRLLSQGKATCKVIPTDSDWFGVTYAGDKPIVMAQLKVLVEKGEYPSPLWK
ncbi:MAG TPA: sugar phosphate nucleotidyltransferase [Williamwhitmania sp.]|nr:sugar phosphate nucleotidyltransferase [Williamwhitmania sp.]